VQKVLRPGGQHERDRQRARCLHRRRYTLDRVGEIVDRPRVIAAGILDRAAG